MNIELAIQGNVEAYETIILEYKEYLFNIAKAIVKNDTDAADAVSETVIKAYRNLKKLKEPTFFKTWITRILINESNDAFIHEKIVCNHLNKNQTYWIEFYKYERDPQKLHANTRLMTKTELSIVD